MKLDGLQGPLRNREYSEAGTLSTARESSERGAATKTPVLDEEERYAAGTLWNCTRNGMYRN